MEEKKSQGQAGKEAEDQAQADHFQAWDKFWGRPGYGAPRQAGVAHKENLMKMLHYPAQVTFTSLSSVNIINICCSRLQTTLSCRP